MQLKPGTAALAALVTRMRGGTAADVEDTVVQALTTMLGHYVDEDETNDGVPASDGMTRAERIIKILASSEHPLTRDEIKAALTEQGDVIRDAQVITNALVKLLDQSMVRREYDPVQGRRMPRYSVRSQLNFNV